MIAKDQFATETPDTEIINKLKISFKYSPKFISTSTPMTFLNYLPESKKKKLTDKDFSY